MPPGSAWLASHCLIVWRGQAEPFDKLVGIHREAGLISQARLHPIANCNPLFSSHVGILRRGLPFWESLLRLRRHTRTGGNSPQKTARNGQAGGCKADAETLQRPEIDITLHPPGIARLGLRRTHRLNMSAIIDTRTIDSAMVKHKIEAATTDHAPEFSKGPKDSECRLQQAHSGRQSHSGPASYASEGSTAH